MRENSGGEGTFLHVRPFGATPPMLVPIPQGGDELPDVRQGVLTELRELEYISVSRNSRGETLVTLTRKGLPG